MQSLNKVDFSKGLGVNFLPNSTSGPGGGGGGFQGSGPPLNPFPNDPTKELNRNLQVTFDSIIGEEPHGDLRLPTWSRVASTWLFSGVQMVLYKFLAIILGPILSILTGIIFALLTFAQIWLARPILRFFQIVFGNVRSFLEIVLNGLFGPAFETIGLCCSNAKLRHQKLYQAKDEPQFPFII